MVPVIDVAKSLNISPQQVRNLIRKKEISGKKIGNTWVVDEASLTAVANKFVRAQADKSFSGKLPNIKAISYFSGAMGLDIGLQQAGIKTIIASEIDKACRDTIIENDPDIGLIGDIREYSPEKVLEMCGLSLGSEIDLIVGGPPCQAFSSAGKRLGFEDERGNVFLTFIDHITHIRPKYAVIENVRGLLSAPLKHTPHCERYGGWEPSSHELKGGALKFIIEKLQRAGYGVSFNLYNAANFGAPQKRERLIIVCSRDGEILPFMEPTHSEHGIFGLPRWQTLREALKGLEDAQHTHVPFPEKRLKYYRLLKAGQNWRDLPEKLKKEAMGNSYYAGGGKTGFYRRLAWDEPSPTLVTHPAMPATDLAHPEQDRPLSVEEYKKLQEFTENWIIKGNKIDQYKQIGNAVPCSLGKAIGKLIVAALNNKGVKNYTNFPYSRYKNTCHNSWSCQGNTGQVIQLAQYLEFNTIGAWMGERTPIWLVPIASED